MKENFEEMFLDVINGKRSVRECERLYGIDRKTFVKMCMERFPEDSEQWKKLQAVLIYNKSGLQKKNVDEDSIAMVLDGLLERRIKTVSDAMALLDDNMDLQTFREHVLDYVNNSKDEELKRKYIAYEAKKYPDYSHINFKALFIEMIKNQESQSQMARKYGIPARTVSRELAKLEGDEDFKPVYVIAKELSLRKRKNGNASKDTSVFSDFERMLINATLENYREGPIIIGPQMTEVDKRYQKAKKLIADVESLNMTQKAAAKELGVSISTIRRATKTISSYEGLRKKEEPDDEQRE